jgi:hypothetical protein
MRVRLATPWRSWADTPIRSAPLRRCSRAAARSIACATRGYGALKAILDILAESESLTLTEISQRLHRTPGSTKDYLSWLEDVDLVISRQKRYTFTDPLLRLWVHLHGRTVPPGEDEIARDVQLYALARIPHAEATPALAYVGSEGTPEERKSWGIIEID